MQNGLYIFKVIKFTHYEILRKALTKNSRFYCITHLFISDRILNSYTTFIIIVKIFKTNIINIQTKLQSKLFLCNSNTVSTILNHKPKNSASRAGIQ